LKLSGEIQESNNKFKNPFSIVEVFQFALIYIVIFVLIKYSQNEIGISGVYIISLISGIIDVDAVTFSAASLSKNGTIFINQASIIVLLAIISNTFFKYMYILIFANNNLKKEMLKVFFINLAIFLSFIFFQLIL
uniref:DUF4010 domain-containing protein n=1 Tax=Sulfurihydrogenibium sp. TaxID=2053621 RepID=UPI00262D0BA1